MSSVVVIGTGYVGLTTGVCLASLGHEITCVDNDSKKVALLDQGLAPIYEPGLQDLMLEQIRDSRLRFTTKAVEAVQNAEFVFLCLPTPEKEDGSVEVRYIEEVARSIAQYVPSSCVVINKSTSPVGMVNKISEIVGRSEVDVVSNPEFLREGNAIQDFLYPARIVVGGKRQEACRRVAELYSKLDCPILIMDSSSAELSKYAANAFLATKISFINSIANICERVGADVRVVSDAIGQDPRIGQQFLRPGPGFGGSCFPKDTLGLINIAQSADYDFEILKSVVSANQQQIDLVVNKATSILAKHPNRSCVALWGLTFKANTDDRRHSPALAVARALISRDVTVRAFDPTVGGRIPELPDLDICESEFEACRGSELLIVLTEWSQFGQVAAQDVAPAMTNLRVFDTRQCLNSDHWRDAGFDYYGLGY